MKPISPLNSTDCVHAGSAARAAIEDDTVRGHSLPLFVQSVRDFRTIESSIGPMSGDGFVYRRYGNPNGAELAATVATLEGADKGLATSSGMGAIASALFSLAGAGDTIALQVDAYGGSRAILADARRFGIETRFVDVFDQGGLAEALTGVDVVLFETISNPLLRVSDARAVADACRQAGAISVVDNTFATPLRARPIELGVDVVVHSVTKFLGGHHDLCAGAVVGRRDLVIKAQEFAARFGLHPSPLDAWLAMRGIKTLSLRLSRSWQSADVIAGALRDEAAVESVLSPDRCALVTFDVGDFERANQVVEALELITLSPSLGGVATTMSHPATSSHRALHPDERAKLGIGDGMLRISVGIEEPDDVIADLRRGLATLG